MITKKKTKVRKKERGLALRTQTSINRLSRSSKTIQPPNEKTESKLKFRFNREKETHQH
jgi:hypothetical protein